MLEGCRGDGRATLDPKLDIVFWMLFGAERNRALLISLLNAVLRPTVPIESAEILHAQPERMGVDDKSIALDVRARLASGEQVDVEMQSQRRPAQRPRALYYWARLYAGQLHRGASYSDLRRCAVILITNFTELASPRFHSTFRLRDEHTAEPLTDHLELHVLELPKLRTARDQNDEPSLMAWGKFLAATSDEELEMLAMQNPVLRQAKDALDRLSADDEARMRAEQREMAQISYELDMGVVWREGNAAGKAEGKAEGKADLVQHLLTLKFGELTPALRERVADATETELQRWSERLLSAGTLNDVFAS